MRPGMRSSGSISDRRDFREIACVERDLATVPTHACRKPEVGQIPIADSVGWASVRPDSQTEPLRNIAERSNRQTKERTDRVF